MDIDGEDEPHFAVPAAEPSFGDGDKTPTGEIRNALLSAVGDLSAHGLKLAAKWTAEQLVGLPDGSPDEQQHQRPAPASEIVWDPWLEGRVAFAKTLLDVGEFERASQVFGDRPSSSPGVDNTRGLPPRARFLRWYSLYLAGERKREEESQLTDALQRRRLVNPHIPALYAELSALDAEGSLDAYGLFIYGAVLKSMRGEGRSSTPLPPTDPPPPKPKTPPVTPTARPTRASLGGGSTRSSTNPGTRAHDPRATRNSFGMAGGTRKGSRGGGGSGPGKGSAGRYSKVSGVGTPVSASHTPFTASTVATTAMAEDVLARSLRLYPYNWSAWLDLASLCLDGDNVPASLEEDPPCSWMYQFFLQHLLLEQHRYKDALAVLDELAVSFPESSYVLAQTAVCRYHMREFDQAHGDFKELRLRDPLRMEGLDVFSNILYVKECKAELSYLAHITVKSAPLRPETNCIIGNYYSLKGQHEKAVVYFLRALKRDRRCLSAWTLMGHEFIELKNSGAAIESYRQAADINPKDYRAWYGLGQAYEILQMHLYATYYYRRATALRPYDARMWIALGNCLEALKRRSEAISIYERAMANDDREGISLHKLAVLYKEEGRTDAAAKCYEKMLRRKERDNASAEEGKKFLCYYYKGKGEYEKAVRIAHSLLDHSASAPYARRYNRLCSLMVEYNVSREEALAILRELRSMMDTQQKQKQEQVLAITGGSTSFTDDVNASSLGQSGLTTPHPGIRKERQHSGPGTPGSSAQHGSGTASAGAGSGASGSTRRGQRTAAAGQHPPVRDNAASLMSPTSVDMSVAMSLGSDSGGEAGGAGADDSFGDLLSP